MSRFCVEFCFEDAFDRELDAGEHGWFADALSDNVFMLEGFEASWCEGRLDGIRSMASAMTISCDISFGMWEEKTFATILGPLVFGLPGKEFGWSLGASPGRGGLGPPLMFSRHVLEF